MRKTIGIAMLAAAAGYGQTFEVASIKTNAPGGGFHLAGDAVSGGPGTADPGTFRCMKCSLATLIVKAFDLQPYQLPARASLMDRAANTYDVEAKVAAGTSADEFSAMLRNLLKDRFGLAWHFQEKAMKGYRLVVAKGGPKLAESGGAVPHAAASGEAHGHSGVMAFGSSASYRGEGRSMGELARVLSDQIGAPVSDETGLVGKYDVSLRWSGNGTPHTGDHPDGGFAHGGHDGAGAAGGDASGPTLFDAVQQQLGLRLVAAEQTMARLFVIDHVAPRPTEN